MPKPIYTEDYAKRDAIFACYAYDYLFAKDSKTADAAFASFAAAAVGPYGKFAEYIKTMQVLGPCGSALLRLHERGYCIEYDNLLTLAYED